MTDPANILLIRLKSIGDVVFTVPAVNLVRDNFPGARITMLTSIENQSLVGGFRAVDEILALDRMAFKRFDLPAIWANTFGLRRRIGGGKFDLAVDFQGYGETALMAWLTRAPERWGGVNRPGRAWAYTRGVTRPPGTHPVEWNLELLRQCGLKALPPRNDYRLAPEDNEAARLFLEQQGCDPAKPLLYLQPFTSSAFRNWPLDKYQTLARHWRKRGAQVVAGGGPNDRPALEATFTGVCAISAGESRATNYGMVQRSKLVVGSDTGFLHLAVAMGKRVLMLIQPHGPGTARPFGHPDWTVESEEGQPVATIEVEKVIEASEAALQQRG